MLFVLLSNNRFHAITKAMRLLAPLFASDKIAGITLFCVGVFLSACMDTTAKLLTIDFHVVQIIWLRFFVYFICAALFLGPAKIKTALKTRGKKSLFIISAMQTCLALLFVASFAKLPLLEVQTVAMAGPIVTTIAASIFLKEHVSWYRWLGLLGCFGAITLSLQPHFESANFYIFLPVLAIFCAAITDILKRHLLVNQIKTETVLIYTAIIPVLVLAFLMPRFWESPNLIEAGLFFLVGFICAIRDYTKICALDKAEVSALKPFSYTMVFWAALFGLVAFGDKPTIETLIAIVAVLTISYFVFNRERAHTKKKTLKKKASNEAPSQTP